MAVRDAFQIEDIRWPGPDEWDGTLGLDVFSEEVCDGCSDVATDVRYWDHDTVQVTPGSGSN